MRKRIGLISLVVLSVACGSKPADPADCSVYPDCDADSDGWTLAEGDCDDADAGVHPEAEEIWYDGIDGDCSGTSDFDADQDGYVYDEDCDDNDAGSTSLAEDADCDGIHFEDDCDDADPDAHHLDDDADCDGVVFTYDCDDLDSSVGAPAPWYSDYDNDGYGDDGNTIWSCDDPGFPWVGKGGDCDDSNAGIHPTAPDSPHDGVDTDCDGTYER